jgi:hypothetical protein
MNQTDASGFKRTFTVMVWSLTSLILTDSFTHE